MLGEDGTHSYIRDINLHYELSLRVGYTQNWSFHSLQGFKCLLRFPWPLKPSWSLFGQCTEGSLQGAKVSNEAWEEICEP